MDAYLPVLMFLLFGTLVGCVLSALSYFLGPRRGTPASDPDKFSAVECGVPMVTDGRERMSVKFYLTAILFILFDIETVFLYLWAKTFRDLGWFGITEISVFVALLLAGYFYVVKRGALEWE